MSIEFNKDGYIYFGSILNNQTIKSGSAWISCDTYPSTTPSSDGLQPHTVMQHTGGGWFFKIDNGRVSFVQASYTSTGGFSPAFSLSTSTGAVPFTTWTQVGFSHDGSSAALVTTPAKVYKSGNQITVSDTNYVQYPATGALGDDADGFFWVGGVSADSDTYMMGKLKDIRLYDRVLSSDEWVTLSDSNNINRYVVPKGLIFWLPGIYIDGSSSFDGVTISTGQRISDVISGTQGVPAAGSALVGHGVYDEIVGAGGDEFSFSSGSSQRLWFDDAGIHTTVPITS